MVCYEQGYYSENLSLVFFFAINVKHSLVEYLIHSCHHWIAACGMLMAIDYF